MRKTICIFITLILLISSILCIPASASYDEYLKEMTTYSECLFLICSDNGEVIFEKEPDRQTYPASLTKVITATVVLENVTDLEEVVTVPEKCIRELDGTGSSLGGLKVGEQITVHNLLYCLLLQSANEAATTLADYVTGGDRQAFIDKMNELAERLGCTNSHFVNPHGLDDEDQYVTARDMATFFKYAYSFPAFAEICGLTTYELPASNLQEERSIRNTNYTLYPSYKDYYCKYIKGGKTGSTSVAGHNLVSCAAKDGYNYIAVALKAPKEDFDGDNVAENGSFLDTKAMYEWAFSNLKLVAVADPDRIVTEIPVKYGKNADTVTLSPSEKTFGLLPNGTDATSLLIRVKEGEELAEIKAPIKKGDFVCKGEVLYADEVIAEIDLLANATVKRSFFAYIGSSLGNLFSTFIFKIILAAAVIALAILLYLRFKGKKNGRGGKYKVLNYSDIIKFR